MAFTAFTGSDYTQLTTALLGQNSGISIEAGSVALVSAGDGAVNFYDGAQTALGIGGGLLLTSGTTPGETNTSAGFGSSNFTPGDADIDAVVQTVFNSTSNDATTLAFSFTVTDPNTKSVSFDLVFGSEEYPEFADEFVDAAVVMVNGVNYALFDGDAMHPLSVLNSNLGYFQDNQAGTLPIEYDGVSHVLKIVVPVNSTGVNTIKIGIADTGDAAYDSGMIIANLVAGTSLGGGVVVTTEQPVSVGTDKVVGSDLSEYIDAQAGNDKINAGGGNDIVIAGDGNDKAYGEDGDDVLQGGLGNDLLDGGEGNNTIDGGGGNDTVKAGAGDDLVTTYEGADKIAVGDGDNVIDAGDGANKITTLDGDDTIITGIDADNISAGGGNNEIEAGDGTNKVATEDGDDLISTGDDTDKITAGGGNNVIDAGDGTNSIAAGDGDDAISAGDGNDKIAAGDGNNEIEAGDGVNSITTGSGDDFIATGSGNDKIKAGDGDNLIDSGDGSDTIATGAGDDEIHAGAGIDKVQSGEGADLIDGGAGADKLTGGADADLFVFSSLGDGSFDTITDFADEDTIAFDTSVFTQLAGATADNFRLGTVAADADDFLLYNAAKGQLYYDADGSGSDLAVQIAVIKGADAKTVGFDDFAFLVPV